jgi:hypothetical protein
MVARMAGLVALLAGLNVALAGVGGLEDAAPATFDMLVVQPQTVVMAGNFEPAGAGSGLTSSHAQVAELKVGKYTFRVAVDGDKADQVRPTILRLDFTGRGKFDKAAKVEMVGQERNGQYAAGISVGPITASLAGRDMLVTLSGSYVDSGGHAMLALQVTRAVQGQCAFGQKVMNLRIFDGTQNLSVADPVKAAKLTMGKRTMYTVSGDTVVIDTGDGRFSDPSKLRKAVLGQPINVDGKWYELKVSTDESKVSAQAVKLETGKLHVNQDRWQAMVVSGGSAMLVEGGAAAVDVPVGKYALSSFTQFVAVGKSRTARLELDPSRQDKDIAIEVSTGKTAELAIGAPLTAKPTVTLNKGVAQINMDLRDSSGSVAALSVPDIKPPTLKVIDGAGTVVHEGKMEFG